MVDKLSYTGTIFDASRQGAVPSETNQSARQFFHENVRVLLRNASVPTEFKRSVQDVLPDPGSLSFTSPDTFVASDDPCSRIVSPEMKICQDPAGLSAVSEKITQPLYLTDAMINLSQIEHTNAGLQCFDTRPLSALITNTYFIEACFYPPVYWCPCLEFSTSCGNDGEKFQHFCIDFYLLVLPADEDKVLNGGVVYDVPNKGPQKGKILLIELMIPSKEITEDDGFRELKDADTDTENGFSGVETLRNNVNEVLKDLNKAYKDCCILFSIGKIIFINPEQVQVTNNKKFKSWLTKIDGEMLLDPKANEDNMTLLDAFQKALDKGKRNERNCLKVLVGPYSFGKDEESGKAKNPGDHSVVSQGQAFHPSNNGFLVGHEIGHNLGLDDNKNATKKNDGVIDIMASKMPVGPGVVLKPKIANEDCEMLKTILPQRKEKKLVIPEEKKSKGSD